MTASSAPHFPYPPPPPLPAGLEACTACNSRPVRFVVRPGETLGDVVERLKTEPGTQLSNPSLRAGGRSLYMANPPALREATA